MHHATLSMLDVQSTIGFMKQLGMLVRDARELAGFGSQRDLADAIGKDPSWVSRLERGLLKEMPTPADMARLSEALHLSQAEMLRAGGYSIPVAAGSTSSAVSRLGVVIDRYDWQQGDIDRIARVIQSLGEMRQGTFDVPDVEE